MFFFEWNSIIQGSLDRNFLVADDSDGRKLSAESAQDCSDSSICTSKSKSQKKMVGSDYFWKMGWAQYMHPTLVRTAPDLCGRVPIVSAAQTLVDLVRRSCYAGSQPAVTKCIGTAARSKP